MLANFRGANSFAGNISNELDLVLGNSTAFMRTGDDAQSSIFFATIVEMKPDREHALQN
jgi:hypothetical protein